MAISILVLKEETEAYAFSKKLEESSMPVISIDLVEPNLKEKNPLGKEIHQKRSISEAQEHSFMKKVKIDNVKLLNPKISQKNRQKLMSLWLMPFGFIAGVTFSGMTNLDTFSNLGLGKSGEILFSGVLGMTSGWIGSLFAASSVNPYKEDIESLRKKNQQGKWLLILKTPFEQELPWEIIKELNPIEVVRLNEL